MFLRVLYTIIVLGFAAFIAMQSKADVDLRILKTDISIPLAVVVWCFLSLGIGMGMIWRKLPRRKPAKMPNPHVPVIADLKVCK